MWSINPSLTIAVIIKITETKPGQTRFNSKTQTCGENQNWHSLLPYFRG
jgi:hypothetical protein